MRTVLVALGLALAALAATGTAQARTPGAQLLRTYQPVTFFDPSEAFRPQSVESFVSDAVLEQLSAGSHANYFTPGVHPFDTRCVPPAVLALLRQRGLPVPVDYAGVGEAAGPPGSGLEPTGTLVTGTSPVGPAYHTLWSDPAGTLATWRESS